MQYINNVSKHLLVTVLQVKNMFLIFSQVVIWKTWKYYWAKFLIYD